MEGPVYMVTINPADHLRVRSPQHRGDFSARITSITRPVEQKKCAALVGELQTVFRRFDPRRITSKVEDVTICRYTGGHQTFDKNLVILYKTSQDPTRLQDTAKVLQDRKTAKPEMILTRSLVRLCLGALIAKIEKLLSWLLLQHFSKAFAQIFLHFDLVSLCGGYATRSQGPKDRKIFVEWLMEAWK
ncbi:hypothetical protein K438DRAFT_1766223 [Mycena galopus ATCC 62051]|nr:hypothetical protein K438DRAFT_1766223 [Mycena galopus ATCC 62051]